jgi:hypothetical protein
MSPALSSALFGTLFILIAVWFGLIVWFFRRLRVRHPAAFEAIGSPSLFWNNSMRNNWLFLKFLFQSQWRELGDPQLSAVARGMQIFLIVYTAYFAALVATFMAVGIKGDAAGDRADVLQVEMDGGG